MAVPQAAVLPRLHRGSRTETAAETSYELLAGIGGHDLRWETAPDQRRPFVHLVFTGAALRPARHARMGTVADFADALHTHILNSSGRTRLMALLHTGDRICASCGGISGKHRLGCIGDNSVE